MVENEPLVSIIMVTYNRADWLPKSIGSVLEQTYANWELILWDDGSKDNTKQVVKSIKDKRIIYHYEDNHGKSYALNKSLKLIRGEYVAFLDDDDQWVTTKLDHQITAMQKYPSIDILFGNFQNIDLTTSITGEGFEQNQIAIQNLGVKKFDQTVNGIYGNFLESLLIKSFIAFDSTILRKRIIKEVSFNEGLRNAEDVELWFRLGLKGFQFAFTDEIVLIRIKPEGSLSSPSIVRDQNVIKSIDSCHDEVLKYGRQDLVSLMRRNYRTAWLGLLRDYALSGDKKKAFDAYLNSLHYGMNKEGLVLLLGALAGPKIINYVKGR